ncbi:hypothetical protein [Spirosoma sp. 209]|uniref:hypothetical protein n=1 Tax=Spirosoma sp. 209 TaxID=1955701 RepID=UPI00098D23BF|nr:hypothetical protein [Spirosoma sp. 209]
MPELLKIDPYLELVYPVDVSDSLTDICRQIGARRLTIAGQQPDTSGGKQPLTNCLDAAYCDEEAIHAEPLPPAFRLRPTGHIIYGCALWHRVTEQGALQPPAWLLPELIAHVEFLGFQPLAGTQSDSMMLDDESLPLGEPNGD